MNKRKLLAMAVGFMLSAATAIAQTLAFPTAEGFGKYATGGRGGAVVEVTNLLDDPDSLIEGSFRWALKQYPDEPLTVVFRVSGTIDLKGNDLRSKRDNITIAGQTAPGDGICFKGGTINLGGSRNIIVRHIRSRIGILGPDSVYCPGTVDEDNFIAGSSFNIENGGNFILDHCSFSWSAEEVLNVYDNDHTTVQWCIMSEGLYNAGHAKGSRSYGGVWGGQSSTYHHNLLAHNKSRSPRFGSCTSNDVHVLLDVVNNVSYNYGNYNACYGGDNRLGDEGLFELNFVNNYWKPGPARSGAKQSYFVTASFCDPAQGSQGTSYGHWHLDGNYMTGSYAKNHSYNTDNYNGFNYSAYTENVSDLTLDDMKSDHIDVGEYAVNTETAEEAYESVLANVGAFPRDSHDTRILEEVTNGTTTYYGSLGTDAKGIIDKPSDSGGYPVLNTYDEITDDDHDGMDDAWETANGFDPTNANDRNTTLKDGYTALDAYLCSLVGEEISLERDQPFDIIVAKDGTGDYTTINEAIEAAPDTTARTIIFVKNGTYNEKVFVGNRYENSSKVLSIIGQDRDSVIIVWDDYNGKEIEYPGKGTITADGMTCPTMTVTSPDFYMENVTVRNTVKEDVAQAVALYQAGDRQILKNVSIEGYQDTYRTKKSNRYFLYDCTVKGNTDFIYGGGLAYFYKSNIVSRGYVNRQTGGYITAPEDVTYKATLSTGNPLYYEFIFNNCELTAEDGITGAYLGRPWQDSDMGSVFMNSVIGSHIDAAGWAGDGNNTNMSFAEYNNTNPDGTAVDRSGRVDWSIELADSDMYLLNAERAYAAVASDTFAVEEAVVGVVPPTDIINNGEGVVRWTASSGARGYIVYLDGKIVGYTEGALYYDPSAPEGTYTVRAIAENGALSQWNDTEYTLTATELNKALNAYYSNEELAGRVRTITVAVTPEGCGTVSEEEITANVDDELTIIATPAEGYDFKNWTDADGDVLGTDSILTYTVSSSTTITANFKQQSLPRAYYEPTATDYEFELVDLTMIPEQVTNASTGDTEWQIKHEYTSWVYDNETGLNVSGRQVEYVPETGELVDFYLYSTVNQSGTDNMMRVGTTKSLSLFIANTTKMRIFFNGAASTPGHLVVTYTDQDGNATTVESANDYGKTTTRQSDYLDIELDGTKQYEFLFTGTEDQALWAMLLWPGDNTGVIAVPLDEAVDGAKSIYDVIGRKVTTPREGEINIIDGKKYSY